MEIREFAERVLTSDDLAVKLARFEVPVTDADPGRPQRFEKPARPPQLQFAPRRTAPAMPRPGSFADPHKRAVAHHIMANHELQALEVMAWVLCAFPDAPAEFRRGMVKIMEDEQRHTRMHIERAAALGITFGELPVNCYIWKKALAFKSVLDYLAGLPLTFEGANLDHTLEFAEYFRSAGDERGAAIMQAIHRDEIQHVAFGLHWLRRLKRPEDSDWTAYQSHLHWPLRPTKSKGDRFHREPRLAAGMSDEFIDQLERAGDEAGEQGDCG
jgi:uncharacterized ferritin-like protein (DUF455 family)